MTTAQIPFQNARPAAPSGFIERLWQAFCRWRDYQRYHPILSAAVAESLQLVAEQDRNGPALDPTSTLVDAIVPDFPPPLHEHVRGLGEHLKGAIDRGAANALAEIQTLIDLNIRAVDELQAEVVDARNLASTTDELANPPTLQVPNEEHFQNLETLTHHRATRVQLRFLALLAMLMSAVVTGAEGSLVYLSLLAVFGGVDGISPWMLPLQSAVLTLGLLFLAHKSRKRTGTNTDWRWLSRAVLCLVALALAALRAGVVVLDNQGLTVGPFAALESWGLVFLVFLVSVVLAVLGADAYDRARDLFNRANALWDDPQVDLRRLEASVAVAGATRLAARRLESQRHSFHAQTAARARNLERELRRRHQDTRALLHDQLRRVHARLGPTVKHTAWQLARLRHGEPAVAATAMRERPLLLPALLLGIGLWGTSCGFSRQARLDEDEILDTSGSMPADVAPRVREEVLQDVQHWARTAASGSVFTIWWLASEGSAFPAERMSLTMPALQVPAHRHRQRLEREFQERVTQLLQQLPSHVPRTRLLESLFYIGSTTMGPWRLTVYSDLQEDSEAWDEVRAHLGAREGAKLVSAMLTICPSVEVPPSEVALRSWPGLVTAHRAGIREHQRDEALFRAFFARWAPKATVHMEAI